MRNKLTEVLNHATYSITTAKLFVADHKNAKDGLGVVVTSDEQSIPAIHINNPSVLPVAYDCFPENAFPKFTSEGEIIVGSFNSQCECMLFPEGMPSDCKDGYWILLIETKYCYSEENATRVSNNYANIMVKQIIETTEYLRERGILNRKLRVYALVAFPTLSTPYQGFRFDGTVFVDSEGTNFTIQKIAMDYKISIRDHDCAQIRNEKKIVLGKCVE